MPDPNQILIYFLILGTIAFLAGLGCGAWLAGQRKDDSYSAAITYRKERDR